MRAYIFCLILFFATINGARYYQEVRQNQNRRVYLPKSDAMSATTGQTLKLFGEHAVKYTWRRAKYKAQAGSGNKDRGTLMHVHPNTQAALFLGPLPLTQGFITKGFEPNGIKNVVRLLFDGLEDSTVTQLYDQNGINELRLNNPDHEQPSLGYILAAIEFMQDKLSRREPVYVHCKGGHGRSASIVFLYLMIWGKVQTPLVPWEYIALRIQQEMNRKRHIRYELFQQENTLALLRFVDTNFNPRHYNIDYIKHKLVLSDPHHYPPILKLGKAISKWKKRGWKTIDLQKFRTFLNELPRSSTFREDCKYLLNRLKYQRTRYRPVST